MLLSRLSPLALVLLAACSRAPEQTTAVVAPVTARQGTPPQAPDYSACRLVGTWRRVTRLPPATEADLRAQGLDPAVVLERTQKQLRAQGKESTENFASDGAWHMTGIAMHDAPRGEGTWSLVQDQPERVSITIPEPRLKNGTWKRTFVFESPDLLREEGGVFDGVSMERVLNGK